MSSFFARRLREFVGGFIVESFPLWIDAMVFEEFDALRVCSRIFLSLSRGHWFTMNIVGVRAEHDQHVLDPCERRERELARHVSEVFLSHRDTLYAHTL